jgi:hypothetical protein
MALYQLMPTFHSPEEIELSISPFQSSFPFLMKKKVANSEIYLKFGM